MALTPDRRKSAMVGVTLSLFGLGLVMYGTSVFPQATESGYTFAALMLTIFGILLTVTSLLVFVLPAAIEYLKEGMNQGDL